MTLRNLAAMIVKQAVWRIMRPMQADDAWPLTIRSGPAKGSVLVLDLRKNGSYWLGIYDNWILDRLKIEEWLAPGDLSWDCGAYVGYYAAVFRRCVGARGKVIAFEASSSNYARLAKMPSLNGWSNVTIVNSAVGQDHSELDFAGELGGASGPLSTKRFTEDVASERVRSAGIDELAYELGYGEPAFIKLDLEGAEVMALHNGDRLFSTKRPVVLLEVHGPAALSALGQFLQKFDYGAWDVRYFNDDGQEPYRNENALKIVADRLCNTMVCLPSESFSRRQQVFPSTVSH
jgi:FkbM family methyltransferase